MNALEFVRNADIGGTGFEATEEGLEAAKNVIDVRNLPSGLVIGNTLLDLSGTPSPAVRAGVSLSMLFASRVASNDPNAKDEDSWLASYQTALGQLGFSLAGSSEMRSKFKKLNVGVHQAIIPFLTIAFGGAGVGPIILAALENLNKVDPKASWITLFDKEARRFAIREMHFGATVPNGDNTEIRYAVARLNVEQATTQVLFFKVTKDKADFESLTTRMSANNSLMAVMEGELTKRLSELIKSYIWSTKI
jgi:hypothetical protein